MGRRPDWTRLIIPGMSVELTHNDKHREGRFLGRLREGRVILRVSVPQSLNMHGLMVVWENSVFLKRKLEEGPKKGMDTYERKIAVKSGGSRRWTRTDPPDNTLTFLEIGEKGGICVWEVAVVSQYGDFWLTVQPIYLVRCYRSNDRIVCPALDEKWPQLVEVAAMFLKDRRDLEPLPREFRSNVVTIPEHAMGRVLWWSVARGFGEVLTRGGEVARVDWQQIPTRVPSRFACLWSGELVVFKDSREIVNWHKHGHEAGHLTELLGVMPIEG